MARHELSFDDEQDSRLVAAVNGNRLKLINYMDDHEYRRHSGIYTRNAEETERIISMLRKCAEEQRGNEPESDEERRHRLDAARERVEEKCRRDVKAFLISNGPTKRADLTKALAHAHPKARTNRAIDSLKESSLVSETGHGVEWGGV